MTTKLLTALLLGTSILGSAGVAYADDVTLNIESWRGDDLAIWKDKLIPAFEAKNPGIKVVFAPSAPTEYDAALGAKLAAGSAGDLITCRPFDKSLELFKKGNLADLSALPGMENFSAGRQVRLADRRRQGDLLRADGLGHPRLHLQQGRLRQARHQGAGRPATNSSPRSTRSRPTAPTSRWRWAPRISGKPRPWATRTSARTTGRARKAARR